MSSRRMSLLPRATLHSDSEQGRFMKKNRGQKSRATVPLMSNPQFAPIKNWINTISAKSRDRLSSTVNARNPIRTVVTVGLRGLLHVSGPWHDSSQDKFLWRLLCRRDVAFSPGRLYGRRVQGPLLGNPPPSSLDLQKLGWICMVKNSWWTFFGFTIFLFWSRTSACLRNTPLEVKATFLLIANFYT